MEHRYYAIVSVVPEHLRDICQGRWHLMARFDPERPYRAEHDFGDNLMALVDYWQRQGYRVRFAHN